MAIDVRIRDLGSDEERTLQFDSLEDAALWLAARPRFVEGVGMSMKNLDEATSQALRAKMRPLDDDERKVKSELEQAKQLEALAKERRAEAARIVSEEKQRVAMRDADPNRPMEVQWTYDGNLQHTDPRDERPIPQRVKDAVLAWVEERQSWVRGRGQMVGEATLMLLPGELTGSADRVLEGRFVPVAAE